MPRNRLAQVVLLDTLAFLAQACGSSPRPDYSDVPSVHATYDTLGDDDDSDAVPTLLGVHPLDGATDQGVHERLWVDFAFVAPSPTVTLETIDGAWVQGSGVWLTQTRFSFEPADGLEPDSTYVAVVSWGRGQDAQEFSWEFATSAVGTVPTGAPPAGDAFVLDLASGTVVAPVGGQSLLDSFGLVLLHSIQAVSDTQIDFLSAMAGPGATPPTQDLCSPSIDLDVAQQST